MQQLAVGSCLVEFQWNGGAQWKGKAWRQSGCPTDSALVAYLFASHMLAPGWKFPREDQPQASSIGGPLFIGSLPPMLPSHFSAILPQPPAKEFQDTAVIVVGRSEAPCFSFVLDGETKVVLQGHSAVFQVLCLLLLWAHTHAHEHLAGFSLRSFGLKGIVSV